NGEKDRDLPLCSQIKRFVDDALAERAVTDETHAQIPSALLFEGLGKPDRNWSHATLNSIREESRIPEMLAAALSARCTACSPHHLGDQAFKIAGHAQIVSMSAMIGHDIVVGT